MKLIHRALYAWNWRRLLRERRTLSHEGLLSGGRAAALSRRMDRRCVTLSRLEQALANTAATK